VIALLLVLSGLGLGAGALLLRRVPVCSGAPASFANRVSIIIPARNEEENLPRLLGSLGLSQPHAPEVIVVDDSSTDATAMVAARAGARVITAGALPAGWTGKTWACAQGAERANGQLLLFLDADTWFAKNGLEMLMAAWEQNHETPVALSVLPYHVTQASYEELSLFFNLLMAFGAGGFGAVGKARLFGQCLLISRELYEASGGHASVRGRILENFAMADRIEAVGAHCVCLGGRGVLQLRMFPEGLAQLCESWKKAFADGAAASDSAVLTLAIVWLSALSTTFILSCVLPWPLRGVAAALYVIAAAQVFWSARQVGSFRLSTAILYPIPLLFFFGLFTDSLLSRIFRRQVKWRGRRI
jgi:4,4'-diaponeurosporenoate glycosyltransferase